MKINMRQKTGHKNIRHNIIKGIIKNISLFILLIMISGVLSAESGSFTVESGDGKQIASSDLSGTVSVFFYETKDNKELNRLAKTQLNQFYYSLDANIRNKVLRFAVIDCSGVSKPLMGIWKKQLVKYSKIEGIVIYGDWDGDMKKRFSFEKDCAYLVVVDQKGKICFCEKGPLSQQKIDKAEQVMISLIPSVR